MNASDLEKASKTFAELRDLETMVNRAKEYECFRLEMRGASTHGMFEFVGHCNGQSTGYSGSYGELAEKLKAVAIEYYEKHAQRARDELASLGVKIAA